MRKTQFTLALLALAASLALSVGNMAHAQTEPVVSVSIAAQPLGQALNELARQAGLQLSFPATLVTGKTAPAVSGNLTTRQALARLLAGSGLEASINGTEVIVRPAPTSSSSAATLAEVVVTGKAERADGLPESYAGGQVARGARLGFLGNTDVMDTPLSIVGFTAQVVENQQARTVGEVVANDASVRLTGNSNGFGESFSIRGFPINDGNIGDLSFDGLYGVAPNFQASAAYAERVELVKGPTALLNGIAPNGALGGSVNVVPKRAENLPLTRLTLDYATRSQTGVHADVGRRFGENQEWGLRVNGMYRDGETERDKQSAKSLLGSVALDYRGRRLRASLDYVDQRLDVFAPTRQPTLRAGVPLPAAPNARRNMAQSSDESSMRDRSLLARAEYDVSDSLTTYVAAGMSRSSIDDQYGVPTLTNGMGHAAVLPADISSHIRRQSVEAGLRGRLRTGTVEHRWTLGANVYHDELDMGYRFASTPQINSIYDPIDYPEVALAKPIERPNSRSTLRGLALADTMALADDRLLLTLGLRHQQVFTKSAVTSTQYDKNALTPMVGLVFKPLPDLAFFSNYIEGLTSGGTAPSNALNAGEVFAPYKAKQYEAGVKYDGTTWLGTASVFQITKPSGQLSADGYYRTDVEQRNRGLELSIAGEPMRGLRPLAGVTWMAGKLTRASTAVQGNDAPGVPGVQINVGLEWDMPGVPGMTLTGRALHTASQYIDQANTQRIPAWTRLDMGARYVTRIANHAVAFRLQVLNAANRKYWAGVNSWGGLALGEARTVRFSTQVDF